MPTEQFGQSQIKEVRFSKQEIINILHENLLARMSTSYDFDYNRPLVLTLSGDFHVTFRFVQSEITEKDKLREVDMKPLKDNKR